MSTLREQVRESLKKGYSKAEIYKSLLKAGYSTKDLDLAFKQAREPVRKPKIEKKTTGFANLWVVGSAYVITVVALFVFFFIMTDLSYYYYSDFIAILIGLLFFFLGMLCLGMPVWLVYALSRRLPDKFYTTLLFVSPFISAGIYILMLIVLSITFGSFPPIEFFLPAFLTLGVPMSLAFYYYTKLK